MWCSTKELIFYVKEEYVSKGKTLKGIDFLLKVLEKNSPYRNELSLLKGNISKLRIEERLDTISDKSPIRKNDYAFIRLLDDIEEKEGGYIFVKNKREVSDKFELKKGSNPKSYPNIKIVNSTSKFTTSQKIGRKFFLKNWQFLVVTLFFTCLLLYSKNCSENALNQVTTWKNEEASLWAIWLVDFDSLEKAKRKKKVYSKYRNIDIMLLDDKRYHLFIFADSKKEVHDKYSDIVKKKWKNSVIIPIDKCSPRKEINKNYFICN